jgi:flagellar motility protein MotE (MotC chaperone)
MLAVGGIFWVYKYNPTYLGLPPRPQDTMKVAEPIAPPEPEVIEDTAYTEPKVELTVSDFDAYQSEKIKGAILRYQNSQNMLRQQKLMDSLSIVMKNIAVARDSVNRFRDSVSKGANYVKYLNDSLARLSAMYNNIAKENANSKTMLKEREKVFDKKIDSLKAKNFDEFAKIYNNSNPRDVAKILEQLDERDAALILKKMQKKKAGKVLEAMLPENAAAIMVLGVGEK